MRLTWATGNPKISESHGTIAHSRLAPSTSNTVASASIVASVSRTWPPSASSAFVGHLSDEIRRPTHRPEMDPSEVFADDP